jgi:hypothetical protein
VIPNIVEATISLEPRILNLNTNIINLSEQHGLTYFIQNNIVLKQYNTAQKLLTDYCRNRSFTCLITPEGDIELKEIK